MHRGEIPEPKIAKTLGMEFLDINDDIGEIKTRFTISDEFTNPAGQVQGGIIAAMLDDTMGPALVATLEPNHFAPTLNLNVSFLRPGLPGIFTGKGVVVKKGHSICYLAGELFDANDKLVATATATAKINSLP